MEENVWQMSSEKFKSSADPAAKRVGEGCAFGASTRWAWLWIVGGRAMGRMLDVGKGET